MRNSFSARGEVATSLLDVGAKLRTASGIRFDRQLWEPISLLGSDRERHKGVSHHHPE